MTLSTVTDLLYHRSGLLGVSGESSEMRELLASDSPYAAEAKEHLSLVEQALSAGIILNML